MTTAISPLTGRDNVVRQADYATAEITRDYRDLYDVDVAGCFHGLAEISKWRCNDSGLSFFTPSSCAGNAEFYRDLSRHDWYYMSDKWEYDAALKLLPKGGRVLEVGCGHGHFLDQCAQRDLEPVGLELSPPESAISKREKIQIFDELIGSHAENHTGAYDALCAFQVLEHVPEPKPFLEGCCQVLKPGGRLILCTPNADSFLRHSRTLLDIPPHHITGWREETFRYLERMLPLRFERVLFEPLADYHIDYFLGTYRKKFDAALDPRGVWARPPFASVSRTILFAGGRMLLRGQSILAVFTRT